ncbi:MAG: 5'-nucleotidase C-terminal domain-containing protein [Bryobacterales bacterium]|nr:5'-nucleotidase C-terminal domain-containing protein [Bryobacterales bacterium]
MSFLPVLAALLLIPAAFAERVEIGLLVTTDLHGYLYPHDYFTGRPADRGLAKIATLIRQERARTPNVLLVDCGDTIQGSPLEGVHQHWMRTGKLPAGMKAEGRPPAADPMMAAMSRLGFDAMAVGNHEYNFGFRNFEAARKDANFPWISANTQVSGGIRPLAAYIVKTVGGVKVAIIGLTTPAVPTWEKPEHIRGIRFTDGVAAVESALAELKAKHKPDVVVVAAHAGLDRDLRTGAVREGETGFENMVWQVANKVPGVDAIVFGHTHQQLEQATVNGVLLHQPKNWGISLGRVDFALERESGGGRWKVVSKSAKLLPVTRDTAADEEIMAVAKPYHELTERYLNTPVAESKEATDGTLGRVMDSALVDAIQRVQLAASKADVSLTALFNPRVRVPKGPVTVREIASLYIYDNELYAIDGTGKMLREALENAARFFQSCKTDACEGPLINRQFIGFNYDMAQGVEYEIDLTQPAGSRVRNLRYRGKPLDDAQPLRIALNDYRSGGSGGYTMFRGAKVVWKSGDTIRDLIIDYYTEQKALPAAADQSWRIVPDAARRTLEAEARAEAGRITNQ